MPTSNHIHLFVVDDGNREVIPKSIQLVAGRTGQEYNQRKLRDGAFWEEGLITPIFGTLTHKYQRDSFATPIESKENDRENGQRKRHCSSVLT